MKKAYERWGVYDEDQELIRVFNLRGCAEAFCLTNWTVKQLPSKEPVDPFKIVGEALF
jgi:hypothetical protein